MRALSLSLLFSALWSGGCAREPRHPDVLLITVDTLRADHLGCYGYARATTPRLDALAAEGLRFTRVASPRAKTTPAVASLLTGLYPHEHGVRDLAEPLGRDVPLLQEALHRAGYRTGALVGNWVLGEERAGLKRGFDQWVEYLPDVLGVPPNDVPQRTAASLSDGALVALGLSAPPEDASFEPRTPVALEGRPWFLWLHYMDPHGAYAPPQDARVFSSPAVELLPPPPGPDAPHTQPPHSYYVADYNVPPDARLPGGGIDVARVRDLYDGEVHFVDREIGRVLDALRRAGRLDSTLVLVTADHGESLGEHRYWFEHGRYPYETTCHVPLIVRLPSQPRSPRPAPGVRGGAFSLVDLTPTLLDFLELPALPSQVGLLPGGPRGVSRRELLERDVLGPVPVFYEKVERADHTGVVQSKAVRLVDWKLIRRFAARAQPGDPQARELVLLSEELYDLASDPLEQVNRIANLPALAPIEVLRQELERFTEADRDLVDLDRILQRQRERLERGDPEALRVLEALGY